MEHHVCISSLNSIARVTLQESPALDGWPMQLDERVLTHVVPERRSATSTTFATAAWVTITGPDPERTGATGISIARRAEAAAITTTDTGIRREHAGGIIIGVSISGLLLLIVLAWCCSSSRRRSRFSDTSSSSRSTSRPSYSPPPKTQDVPIPKHIPPPYHPLVTRVPPPPSSGYFSVFKPDPPPSQPPVITRPDPSKSGHALASTNFPPASQSYVDVRPPPPPTVKMPGPVRTRPGRQRQLPTVLSGIAGTRYDRATHITAVKRDGKEIAVGWSQGNPQKPVGEIKRKPKNLDIPRDPINTKPE